MSALTAVSAVLVVGLLVYLAWALFRAEDL